MRVVLDSGYLGLLCHPQAIGAEAFIRALAAREADDPDFELLIPEIIDYELRRKLLHKAMYDSDPSRREAFEESVEILDSVIQEYGYAPINTSVMRRAADLWAFARGTGRSTAPKKRLDIDVILASHAHEEGADVLTQNVRHLRVYGVRIAGGF